MVGARGFEPPTSASRTLRANQAALRPDPKPIIRDCGPASKLVHEGHERTLRGGPVRSADPLVNPRVLRGSRKPRSGPPRARSDTNDRTREEDVLVNFCVL